MIFLSAALSALLAAPSAAAISREELKKALDENPDLVLAALKKNKKMDFFEFVVDAQKDYQTAKQAEEEEREKKELEESFKNPMKPALDGVRIRGDKSAPITLVEYSDFQCPFCQRGFRTVEEVRSKYGAKVRFVYKHMPLTNLHPMAMPTAQWMEAVALQSPDKSWIFHDKMFQNQDKLSEDFFKKTVKDLGLDPVKAAKDAASPAVQEKIEADIKEAKAFGFSGTPGFLINGVPLRGAYPASQFDTIISRLGV